MTYFIVVNLTTTPHSMTNANTNVIMKTTETMKYGLPSSWPSLSPSLAGDVGPFAGFMINGPCVTLCA